MPIRNYNHNNIIILLKIKNNIKNVNQNMCELGFGARFGFVFHFSLKADFWFQFQF